MSQRGHIVRPAGARRTWAIMYSDGQGRLRWEGKFKTKGDAQRRLNEARWPRSTGASIPGRHWPPSSRSLRTGCRGAVNSVSIIQVRSCARRRRHASELPSSRRKASAGSSSTITTSSPWRTATRLLADDKLNVSTEVVMARLQRDRHTPTG